MTPALAAYLDAVQARCDRATKGPWDWIMPDASVMWLGTKRRQDAAGGHVLWAGICPACQKSGSRCTAPDDEDATFIAVSRTDVPTLVQLVRELGETLEEIQAYWNGLENERAMKDACHHAVKTASSVLARADALLPPAEDT